MRGKIFVMDEGLQFTEEAELNRYLFYSDLNEINFFVEDKDKEFEYETIFERLFSKKYKIASIISANGKIGVKKAFEEFGEKTIDTQINNFYIVDGDFDRYINPEKMIDNKHFIYLEYYNIENYFLDEKAVYKFSKGKLHMRNAAVKEAVRYDLWKEKIVGQSKKLFLLYCAVQSKLPTIPNVARNEYLFIDQKTGFEREDGYQTYYDDIVEQNPDIDMEIESIKNKYETIRGTDYFGLICGKFLLTSLYVYLSGKIKTKFSKDELRWNLLCDFDISTLHFLEDMVDNVMIK